MVIEKSVKMPDEFQFFLANGDTVRDAVLAWHRGDRVELTNSRAKAGLPLMP